MTEDQIYGGRYHIEDPIGDGAMARVYRATDARLGRVVALKILREQFTNEPEFVERFRLEARLAAGLAHPNIVAVYDVGEDHGRYFIVMEYVPGQNLRQIIARDAPFPLEVVISYMRQLAAGLDYAHSHGVIHRDIKPENILVTGRRELKVGDFGIARALAGGNLTATGTVLGSVSYLSPEQASGQPASAESDLYSAGMVLYEMLTKHVPFAGPNPVAVAMAQVNDTPISPRTFVPELLPSTEAVVLKSISKNPADRFHSGYEMIAALTGQALSPELSQRHVAPAAAAVAAAPTMVASPQMLAAVPRQKPKRGGGGALAALLSTAALLIAAVLIGRSLTSG
ncbi:MAG: Stk1, partial [Chloroflexi bacterium]|nr:Stk1 [Chloroflexota bacterium]